MNSRLPPQRARALVAPTRPPLSVVARAGELQRPRTRRLQALCVLLRDLGHESAHAQPGHMRRSERWRRVIGKHEASKAELDKLVSSWSDRASLRSDHFVVETEPGGATR